MFEFKNLSPIDFENLCRDVLEHDLGIKFENFGVGRDTGIDFRFATAGKTIVVQAKHYEKSGYSKFKSACRQEVHKVKKLAPDRYIIAASVPMTPSRKDELIEIFEGVNLVAGDILGIEDINSRLESAPQIVRRHFKLWLTSSDVMERIFKSAIYERSQSELDEIQKLVPRFVQHSGVTDGEKILDESHCLIISGAPGIGKTTLARILIWLHVEQGWSIKVIDSIDDAFDALSATGKQLIFFDDFLGQVKVTDELVRGTDATLPRFVKRIKSSENLRFILSTRDYIFQQARQSSQRLDDLGEDDANYVLNVGRYSRGVRAQILFNHIYFSDLTEDHKDQLLENSYYLKVIAHANFNPRIIEQITKYDVISKSNKPIREAIQYILDNPSELWRVPYREHFSPADQALMLSVSLSIFPVPMLVLRNTFRTVLNVLTIAVPPHHLSHEFEKSLKQLEGTTLAIERHAVRFVNPGVRDFMNDIILRDGLLPILLSAELEFRNLHALWELFSSIDESAKQGLELNWLGALNLSVKTAQEISLKDFALCMRLTHLSKSPSETALELLEDALGKLDLWTEVDLDVDGFIAVFDAENTSNISFEMSEKIADAFAHQLDHTMGMAGAHISIHGAKNFISRTRFSSLISEELHATIRGWAEDVLMTSLSDELNDVQGFSDLDSLQEDVSDISNYLGIVSSEHRELFAEKESELHRQEEFLNSQEYQSSSEWNRMGSDFSDIHSLFSTLKH